MTNRSDKSSDWNCRDNYRELVGQILTIEIDMSQLRMYGIVARDTI